VDGNAAGDAGFHGEVDVGFDGAVPDVGAVEGHEFFVGGDDGFVVGDGAIDNFACDEGAADEFDDDVDVGVGDDFAPVRGAEGVSGDAWQVEGGDGAAADGGDAEVKP
jgi:hypothetical protein